MELHQFARMFPPILNAQRETAPTMTSRRVYNGTLIAVIVGRLRLFLPDCIYGQYMSQYDARAIASPRVPQNQPDSQLLLGGNADSAAQSMHLNVVHKYTTPQDDPTLFLAGVKQNVAQGYPVIIGVYMNSRIFPGEDDPQYDHIVPVLGVDSNYSLADPSYHPDDSFIFSDNGLYTPDDVPPFFFSRTGQEFLKSREQADAGNQPYALADCAGNFGIAFTGVTDLKNETLPVQVAASVDCESPAMQDGSNSRPEPGQLGLTVTVSNLVAGVTYVLYQYGNVGDVPDEDFNDPAHVAKATNIWRFTAETDSYVQSLNIPSDEMAIFRAVKSASV